MNRHVDIAQMQKIVIVYNRNSGRQLFASMMAKINQVYKLLKDSCGSKKVELWAISSFGELEITATRLVAAKVDWLIIAGGDGTIRALLEKLLEQDCRPYISVFPAGTVNLVAKELLIANEPLRWAHRAVKGIPQTVYLGRANDHLFLTVAGVGFDSLVVGSVTETEKKILNKFAYVWQGTEVARKEFFFSNWHYRFRVRFDEEKEWHDASALLVGKSRYYAGRYNLFSQASLSVPQFFVALFPGASRVDFIRYLTLIALESLTLDKKIFVRSARELVVECNEENFPAELDGDVVTTTPLRLQLEEKPLIFLA